VFYIARDYLPGSWAGLRKFNIRQTKYAEINPARAEKDKPTVPSREARRIGSFSVCRRFAIAKSNTPELMRYAAAPAPRIDRRRQKNRRIFKRPVLPQTSTKGVVALSEVKHEQMLDARSNMPMWTVI